MKKILLFSTGWLILNLIQSVFTEIIDDEAYYWVWSLFPAWGYFDHPPMIAWIIRMGTLFLPGEAGTRLVASILGAGTVFLVLCMLREEVKDLNFAMLMILTVPLMSFHVAGFMAIPDLPLVFFTTLFFFLYRIYLDKPTLPVIIGLCITITLLIYSKYHAFLVLGFTILSNPRLLRKSAFWLIAVVAALLYLPHIFWQVKHHFVSFAYHLVGRNTPFEWRHILNYLGSQVLLLGPLTGAILIIFAFRNTRAPSGKGRLPGSDGMLFRRALLFNLAGFFLFFLLSSLKGHVEPHWVAAAYIPLLLLSVPAAEARVKWKRRLMVLGLVTLPLILMVRIVVMCPVLPLPAGLEHELYHKAQTHRAIRELAGNRPVVFTNSYQDASLQWYFTGIPSFSQNNKYYRKNQFDLLDLEAELQGQEVVYFPRPPFPGCDTLETASGPMPYYITPFFCRYNRVEIKLPDRSWVFDAGQTDTIPLVLGNPTGEEICFCDSCTFPPVLFCSFFRSDGSQEGFKSNREHLPVLAPGEYRLFNAVTEVPEEPGEYLVMFSFGDWKNPAGINSRTVKAKVVAD